MEDVRVGKEVVRGKMENVRVLGGEPVRGKMDDLRLVAHASLSGVRHMLDVRGTSYVKFKGVNSTLDNWNEEILILSPIHSPPWGVTAMAAEDLVSNRHGHPL